jgi:DNA polymerase III sliding clamp (beta) subunit (PCNA family)
LEFVRTSQGSVVEISEFAERRELDLVAGDGEIALATMSAADWRAPTPCNADPVIWPASAVTQLGRVLHAASRDSNRGALRGVLLDRDWFVATDSYRLAAASAPVSVIDGLVVPGEAVLALTRIHRDGECLVRAGSNRISFESGVTTITSTLIAESFPAWKAALAPADAEHVISFSRRDMLAALDRLSVLASKDQLGTLTLTVDGDRLQLECRVPDIGRQVDHIAGASTVEAVSYQLKYLRAVLEQIAADSVELRMDDPRGPAVIRDQGFVALVLPILV